MKALGENEVILSGNKVVGLIFIFCRVPLIIGKKSFTKPPHVGYHFVGIDALFHKNILLSKKQ